MIYQSISQREPSSHHSPNSRPPRGTIHPQPLHHGNGNISSNHQNNYSSNNHHSRVSGRNEARIRVPDFVSIFNHQSVHSPHASEDDFDDEDTIYGRIGGDNSYSTGSRHRGGVSDDYITASDYEYRRFGPPTNRNFSPKFRNGHESIYGSSLGPTLPRSSYPSYTPSIRSTRPGPLPPLPREHTFHENGSHDSSEPPKLPPRDKKKLSKQINTIKKSRHAHISDESDPYSVQIPSPDYLDDRQESTFTKDSQRDKSWNTMRGHQTVNRMGKYTEDRDHIYDTMSRSKSMVMPSGGGSKQKVNPIKMTASTIHLPPKSAPLGYRGISTCQ